MTLTPSRILNLTLIPILALAFGLSAVPLAQADDGGTSPGTSLPPIALGKPTVPGNRAVVRHGVAYAPLAAPEKVKQLTSSPWLKPGDSS